MYPQAIPAEIIIFKLMERYKNCKIIVKQVFGAYFMRNKLIYGREI